MKNILTVASCLIFLTCSPAFASIPDNYRLSGQGEIRYLGLIKVYQASLYTSPDTTQERILDAASSRCLQLDYDVDLSVENFIEAANEILARQHDEATLASVQPQLDLLNSRFRDVKESDSYLLCYDGNLRQTDLFLNEQKLATIPTADFAEVYFGIWLGEISPIDADLRDQLLKGLPGGTN